MNLDEINKKYFTSGTRGYKIINNFYSKYLDLFKKTICHDFHDFSNQIFLNVSKIDFSKDIRNEEAYLIGSLKIQCRILLDRAIKSKNVIPESRFNELKDKDSEDTLISAITPNKKDEVLENLDLNELINRINIFKLQLNHGEVQLLNYLIDEKSRYEIAGETNLKLNTLDTHIRRLRIKFSKFLKKSGYSGRMLDKYN